MYRKWISTDKENLTKLKAKEIAIGDTALGKLSDTYKRELEASYKAMCPHSKSDTIKEFKQWHNLVNGDK